jgi:hypothetical protein
MRILLINRKFFHTCSFLSIIISTEQNKTPPKSVGGAWLIKVLFNYKSAPKLYKGVDAVTKSALLLSTMVISAVSTIPSPLTSVGM